MLTNLFNRKDLAIVFLIYLIVLMKSLYASRLGFGLLDEGEYLHIGLRILRGDIPYRDFFSYLPPLYDYWNTFAFKLFGISVYSPKLLSSFIFSFVPVLYYLVARRFSSSVIALLISLSFGFMELRMERSYFHIFTFSSLVCYFKFLKEKKKKYGFLTGLLLGVLALFRLDISLQFFFGLIITTILFQINNSRMWIYTSIKQLAAIGSGYLVPILGLLYWLVAHNMLKRFIQISITTPIEFAAGQNFPFPKPWNILPLTLSPKEMFSSYEAFFAYLLVAIYLYATYYLVKNWKYVWKRTPELPTLLLIAIFTTPYIFSRPDLGHMVKGGIPAFFIGAFILEKFKTNFKNMLLSIPIILIIIGIAQIVWWTVFYNTTIQTPNGEIRTNSQTLKDTSFVSANTIKESLKFINDNSSSGDQILAVPYMAGLYFLSNRPSKSYVGNIYNSYIPDEEKFVENLKVLDIKLVIYDPVNTPPGFTQQLRSYYPKIDKFIMENYKVSEQTPEGWLLMVKN